MDEVKRSSRKAHPGAQNTGEYVDGKGRRLASALSPYDGWYDRRYVAATAPAADLDECEDFRRITPPGLCPSYSCSAPCDDDLMLLFGCVTTYYSPWGHHVDNQALNVSKPILVL
eukprot:scaffold110603_cov34-Tisochrysis_lutea.AAC.2